MPTICSPTSPRSLFPLVTQWRESFVRVPEGLVVVSIDGSEEWMHVTHHPVGDGSLLSCAWELDHGENTAHWGVPLILTVDHQFQAFGPRFALIQAMKPYLIGPLALLPRKLPVARHGTLPLFRALWRLNQLGHHPTELEVHRTIRDVINDWDIRMDRACQPFVGLDYSEWSQLDWVRRLSQ